MRRNKIALLCLGLLVSSITHSTAQETKEITCTGEVLSAKDEPIAGAKVAAFEMVSDGIAGNIQLHQVAEVKTKADGAFVFAIEPRPPSGTFLDGYVVATKQGLALGWSIWNMREDAESNIELGEPEKLEGVIVDEVGKPIVGAEVRANLYRTVETAEGEEKREWLPGIAPLQELSTQTNNQGRFLFINLPTDFGVDLLVTEVGKATTYTYQSEKSEPAFKSGQMDIRVILPAEARIEGRIVDPDTGQGIAGVQFAVVFTGSGVFFYRFVCTTEGNGAFIIEGLLSGKYLIHGDRLPNTYVDVKSGKTTKVTVRANKPYYVRLLFEDGSPIVIKSEPWTGAQTRIYLVAEERTSSGTFGDIDEQGFFKVYLSHRQYKQLQSGKAWFEVLIPQSNRRAYTREDVFVYDLLATEKAKAGVARIPKSKGEPDSLIGKPLPELKAFNIDLSPDDIKDEMILVCFFDMEQRPSRNCLLQLSKRAQELMAKDVAVVAVHASKVDEDTLNEWIKKNNIPFPVGIVEGDVEKTRFAWGVRSLPWLILTDNKHFVVSEGFSLQELDNELEQFGVK